MKKLIANYELKKGISDLQDKSIENIQIEARMTEIKIYKEHNRYMQNKHIYYWIPRKVKESMCQKHFVEIKVENFSKLTKKSRHKTKKNYKLQVGSIKRKLHLSKAQEKYQKTKAKRKS